MSRPAPKWGICCFSNQKKKTNAQQMPERGSMIGMLGIDWAITELKLAITISRTAHINTEVKTWVFKGVFGNEGGHPLFITFSSSILIARIVKKKKTKQSFSREYNPSRSLGLDIFQKELFSFKYHSLSSDYFDYLCNVWIDRPLMPSSDVTTPLL